MDIFGGRPMLQAGALAVLMAVCGFYFNESGKLILALVLLLFAVFFLVLYIRKTINSYRLFANIVIILIGFGVLASSYVFYDVGYKNALSFVGDGREIVCEINGVKNSGAYYSNYEVTVLKIDNKECDFKGTLECKYPQFLQRRDVVKLVNVRVDDALSSANNGSNPLSDGLFLDLISEDSEDCISIFMEEESIFDRAYSWSTQLSIHLKQMISGESGDLASAMLLGNRNGLSASVQRDFSRSGVSHLLAISGLHLSMIASVLGLVLSLAKCGKGVRSFILLLFIVLYLFLIGFPISAVRAAIMLGITYISFFLGMSDDGLSSLGLAAWFILIISPSAILDLGFILSFCATFGILAITPYFDEKFHRILRDNHLKMRLELEEDPSKRPMLNKKRKRFIRFVGIVRKFVFAVVVACAVWLISILPVWYSIGTISLASLLSNVLLSAAVWLFILLSIITILTGFFPVISAIVGGCACAVGDFILSVTSKISLKEHVLLSLRHKFVGHILIVAVILTVVLMALKLKRKLLAVLPSYIGITAVIIGVLISNHSAQNVKTDFISVNGNEAIVMTSGDGAVICDVSGGSLYTLNSAYSIATESGATEVEAVILTHYHEKHLSAVASFAQSNRVRRLYLPLPRTAEDAATMSCLYDAVVSEGVECYIYSDSESLTFFEKMDVHISSKINDVASKHSGVSLLIRDKDISLAYLSASALTNKDATVYQSADHLILGAHGSLPTKSDNLFIPSAEEVTFADKVKYHKLIPNIKNPANTAIKVNCSKATMFFD